MQGVFYMDLEFRHAGRAAEGLSAEDSYKHIPAEFRSNTGRYMRRRTGVSDKLYSCAVICFGIVCLTPFFVGPFVRSPAKFNAKSLETPDGLGFVSFLGGVEDLSESKMKDMFGWGSMELIYRASEALAPHLQNCRARLQSSNLPATFTFRFDAKIDVAKPGFNISGLLDGQEAEPDAAACLRDKINALQIPDFSRLRATHPKLYKMRLGVQLAHGSDGGAP
jgi:hypothetical protein